jgi:hypothetical protein
VAVVKCVRKRILKNPPAVAAAAGYTKLKGRTSKVPWREPIRGRLRPVLVPGDTLTDTLRTGPSFIIVVVIFIIIIMATLLWLLLYKYIPRRTLVRTCHHIHISLFTPMNKWGGNRPLRATSHYGRPKSRGRGIEWPNFV